MQVPLQNRLKCFTPSWYLGSSHCLARPQVSLSVCGLFGVKKGYKILPLAQLHRRITRKGEFLLLSKIAYKVKIVSNSGNIYSPGSSPNKSVHSDWLQNIAAVKENNHFVALRGHLKAAPWTYVDLKRRFKSFKGEVTKNPRITLDRSGLVAS